MASTKNNWLDWSEAENKIKSSNIDIFGCAESNLAWTKAKREYAKFPFKKKSNKQIYQLPVAWNWEHPITNPAAPSTVSPENTREESLSKSQIETD
jgi:hypothetical protein